MKVVRHIRTTRDARPFHTGWALDGEHGADLEASEFIEDEFIVAGDARTYTYDDGWKLQTATEDAPYTTRVLIRRPADPARASGLWLGEPLHPGSDHDLTWRSLHPWILRSGHSWIGVSVTPRWAEAMASDIDPGRYSDLSIPLVGMRWDILSEALGALRSGAFFGASNAAVSRLIVSGWSMTGSICRVFLGDGFHARTLDPSGRPAVDGYVIGISSGGFIEGGYPPLSDACPTIPADDPRRLVGRQGVPVIELLSENESETHGSVLREDADDEDDRYRLYEVAGSGHGASRNRTGWPGDDAAATRRPGVVLVEQWSDFPLEYVARAVFDHLDRWITGGDPPPRAPRIPFADSGPVGHWSESQPLARDAVGNALGGIRSTYVDVPVATYTPHSTLADPATATHSGDLYPHVVPFSADELTTLYGAPEVYWARVSARADDLVDQGWLLPDEADLVRAEAGRVRF